MIALENCSQTIIYGNFNTKSEVLKNKMIDLNGTLLQDFTAGNDFTVLNNGTMTHMSRSYGALLALDVTLESSSMSMSCICRMLEVIINLYSLVAKKIISKSKRNKCISQWNDTGIKKILLRKDIEFDWRLNRTLLMNRPDRNGTKSQRGCWENS